MSSKKSKSKLERFAGQIAPARKPGKPEPNFPERYHKLSRTLKGELITGPAGAYCLVRTFYPFNFRFGEVCLTPPETKSIPCSAVHAHDSGDTISVERLLFVDTETTGLGGAGTVPFLIGCGSLVEGGFEVRQYLLPDYADEAQMLEGISEEIRERNCSVTYNGGPFDLPIIRDRMIINRVSRELGFKWNFDLLPATRRLYRRRLKSCTLTNIEREVFRFYREDDTPGYLIPAIYFDWLGTENLRDLPGVLEHNAWDILGMYFLLERLVRVAESEGEVLDEPEDVYSLQRLYQRRKSNAQVMKLCERLADKDQLGDPEIALFQALALKRSGDWERAVEIWEELATHESRIGYEASIELAKYYEHQLREPARALEASRQAANNLPEGKSARKELDRRINRLNSRL